MGNPWLVAQPATMLAALQLCSVAASGSRDVAWVLASKTTLVLSALVLVVERGQGVRGFLGKGVSYAVNRVLAEVMDKRQG